jgi:hypothetical protein
MSLVGIDRRFLTDVERGKRNVPILNLDLMAKGLKDFAVSVVLAAVSVARSGCVVKVVIF